MSDVYLVEVFADYIFGVYSTLEKAMEVAKEEHADVVYKYVLDSSEEDTHEVMWKG